jgi:hypothetical protein
VSPPLGLREVVRTQIPGAHARLTPQALRFRPTSGAAKPIPASTVPSLIVHRLTHPGLPPKLALEPLPRHPAFGRRIAAFARPRR